MGSEVALTDVKLRFAESGIPTACPAVSGNCRRRRSVPFFIYNNESVSVETSTGQARRTNEIVSKNLVWMRTLLPERFVHTKKNE